MIRVSGKELDDELEMLLNAFLLDIERAGVQQLPDDQDLTKACLRAYLRWQENYSGEGDRYMLMYNNCRDAIAMASEYKAGVE